jgi:hypothetical protein
MRKILYAISLIALAVLVWITYDALYGPNHLTGRIPTHFGIDGTPNAWGEPRMLLLLPAVAIFLYLLMTITSRFPNAFNYPVRVTPQNRAQLQAIALNMVALLTTETVCLFAGLHYQIILSVRQQTNTISVAFMPGALIIIFGTIVFHIAAMRRVR